VYPIMARRSVARTTKRVKGWLAVFVRSSDGKAVLQRRKDDATATTAATSASALSLTSGNWYTAKVVARP
jgi:hypothetical protein